MYYQLFLDVDYYYYHMSINTNDSFINKIKTELIQKTFYDDLKYNIRSKSRWKFISDICEAISNILAGIAAILAFAAGVFDYSLLSFIAGCCGTSSMVFLHFSTYAMRESRERTHQVNKILSKLGLDTIPDISINSTEPQNDESLATTNNIKIDTNNQLPYNIHTNIGIDDPAFEI